ncbi:hypothetical protein CKAN_02079500 [Cinnamomum micranthum f. kanehirae]|uniref:Uncharacterized protein n=1 Tax=Cinnamomum micranthum f. kanehirae TaxID=337451 RepID=A0A443PLK9_9MAGN|nr:hypothetical protein CKAN_02079500 [Cinnamomum micranthum f. kanehirae]
MDSAVGQGFGEELAYQSRKTRRKLRGKGSLMEKMMKNGEGSSSLIDLQLKWGSLGRLACKEEKKRRGAKRDRWRRRNEMIKRE